MKHSSLRELKVNVPNSVSFEPRPRRSVDDSVVERERQIVWNVWRSRCLLTCVDRWGGDGVRG